MKRRSNVAIGGFTYVGAIVLLAILGLVGAATLKATALMQRAAAEEELLATGAAFMRALRSYAAATPPGRSPRPASLHDLLRDPRYPGLRRHLRKIYLDPVTGKAEWGVIYRDGGDGSGGSGVIGVHSLSQATPLKVANFRPGFEGLAGSAKLSDWRFVVSLR